MKSESAATNRPTLGPVTFGIRKLRRAPFKQGAAKLPATLPNPGTFPSQPGCMGT